MLLDLTARDPAATFRLATTATSARLDAATLARVVSGELPAAGVRENFAPGTPDPEGRPRMGRPNGVFAPGSRFVARREVVLEPGLRTGELTFPTRFRNVSPRDVGDLSAVLLNPADVGAASTHPDGHYGLTYALTYTLVNPTTSPMRVAVLLTSPGAELHRPVGGELTMPVRVDGRVVRARVNQRGDGRVLAIVEVPAGARRTLEVELTNFGNTFPPAGIELRAEGG